MGLYLVILILLLCDRGDFEFPANILLIHRINLIIILSSFYKSHPDSLRCIFIY